MSSPISFAHLHVHSHYSLLDGLPKIDELVDHAKAQGFSALALTDHGALYGAIEFFEACKKAGIKPIIGAELYVAQRKMTDKQPRQDDRPYHLIVLAETLTGYYNLIELISKANLDGYYYKPRVDLELLKQKHEGLIGLSACLNGAVSRAVLQQDDAAAEHMIQQYQDVFGKENFFLEVQHHPNTPEQATVNAAMLRLTKTTGAPLVATADSHYLNTGDAEAQDILVCIQTKQQLADTNRLSMRNEDYALKTEAEMREWFKEYPDAVDNTGRIAERVNLEIPLGVIQLPHYDLPEGKTANEALLDLCVANIPSRYPAVEDQVKAKERLLYELEVIAKTGFASYFLIVQDFVNWSKANKIVVGPGRGSAAGSIVAYLAGITNIDPLKYDLLFERFLNPERVSMPDIDLDFADTRRDEVIRYVESKYGKGHVAQIITFGTMAARAAIRDVGRALGLTYGFCDMVAKQIPMFTSLEEAMNTVPELKELYASDADAARLLDTARKLEGVVRHTSTHACGVVITKEPLQHYTPIQYSSSSGDTSGRKDIVTQYSLHPIERLGLLKMDFLGLKNLTIIEQTIELIQKTTGEEIDIDHIPMDDKKSYRLLQTGHTTGIFQLESSGMKRYLRELKPTEFDDIIAMVALYRPGPMEMIPDYITGKHGKREVTYLIPQLKPILEKTYGILVYQEQVMALARDVAGFTAGEGYLLIKAVAKKIEKLLNEQKDKFIQGSIKQGVSHRIAEELWEFVEPFAHYGFNKSHSTGYALIAYQTAYLKANYPAQFMASLLTSDQGDSDRIAIEVNEVRAMGIEVMAPDVNESFSTFTVVKESLEPKQTPRIRFGLSAVKNVGQSLITAIINERREHGPFTTVEDFLKRIQHKDLNKKSFESLVMSGACLPFGSSADLLANVDTLLQYNKQVQQEAASGQGNLFGGSAASEAPRLRLITGNPIPKRQQLEWERALLGLYISEHPLANIKKIGLPQVLQIADVRQQKANTPVQALGLVQLHKRVYTKTGDTMEFFQLSDAADVMEVIIFPKTLATLKTVLSDGQSVLVSGKLSKRNGEQKIIAESITAWPDEFMVVKLEAELPKETLEQAKQKIEANGGTLPVYIIAKGKLMRANATVRRELAPELAALLGQDNVVLV